MGVDAGQRATIEAAFAAAQQRTGAPIVCVLAHTSANYDAAPLMLTGVLGLLTPWPLLMFTALSAQRIFLAQIVVCFVASAILMLTPLGLWLTSARARRANAHRAALVQFHLRGLDRPGERGGVLVYVSLSERYARVIAAQAVADAIGQGQWQDLIDALIADLRTHGPARALAGAAPRCADLLASSFPATGTARHRQHFHVV